MSTRAILEGISMGFSGRSSTRSGRCRASAPGALVLLLAAVPGLAAQDLALTGARVLDVTTGDVQADATVLVRDGRIADVGTDVRVPAEVESVALDGRWVIPGMMDAHVHISSGSQARRALESGVTTARSAGVGHYVDVGLARLIEGGHLDGPELLPAGYHVRPGQFEAFWVDNPDLARWMEPGLDSPDALRDVVRANLDREVAWIKAASTERAGLPDTDPRKQVLDTDRMRAIVQEAESEGRPVMTHAHGDAGARAAVAAGVRSIEHGTYMSPGTLEMMAERGTYYVPTIAIVTDLVGAGGDYDDAHLRIRGRHMLPRLRETARRAHELGIPIVASTDTGYGPESVTRIGHELMEFVEHVGMTPLEALQSATTRAAELFRIDDRTGRVASGYEADLVVLERNPLDDIRIVQDPLLVVSDGRIVARRGDW